jgi:hypothetical protein
MAKQLCSVLALALLGSCTLGDVSSRSHGNMPTRLPHGWTVTSTDEVTPRLTQREAGAIAKHGWNSKGEVIGSRFGLFTNRYHRVGSSLISQDVPAWIVRLKGVPCSFEHQPKHCKVAVDLVVIDDRTGKVLEEYQRGPAPPQRSSR